MADQHNSNIPAVGNQISADIPDIKENLEFHKDAFQVIFQAWSDSDNSSGKIDTTTGFSDGTYNYEFPTNGVAAHSVIMLGNSSTIAWFYINAAPPGWKAYTSEGTDRVLAVSGGSGLYNEDGGTEAGETWANLKAHTHTGPSHNHKFYDYQGASATDKVYNSGGSAINITGAVNSGYQKIQIGTGSETKPDEDWYTSNNGTGATGAQSTSDVRPAAAVGKLWQLDTA